MVSYTKNITTFVSKQVGLFKTQVEILDGNKYANDKSDRSTHAPWRCKRVKFKLHECI